MRWAALAAVLAATTSTASAEWGALSVRGFGVRNPAAMGGAASVEDAAVIAARLLGIGGDAQIGKGSVQLPTGDIFDRPKACAILFVPYVSLANVNDLAQEGSVLQEFFGPQSGPYLKLGQPEPSLAFQDDLAQIAYPLSEDGTVPTEISQDGVADVLTWSYCGKKPATEAEFAQLDQNLAKVIKNVQESYDGQVATQVVLMSGPLASSRGRKLQLGNSTKEQQINKERQFKTEAEAFLLLLWSAILLSVFVLLIFCCIPWADELDPLLKASLRSDEDEKED